MRDLPEVGERASIERVFSQQDVSVYAHLTGDANPVHLDDDAARAAGFQGTIVHGMLVMGLFSQLLGTRLPGPGTIYLGQDIRFSRPVYTGAAVTAVVEVLSIRQDKPVIVLRTWAEADGVVMDGTATVLYRPVAGIQP